MLALSNATISTKRIGEIPVLIVERFDRAPAGSRIIRIHQEDTCQALGRMPEIKYQSQGGPSPGEIFELIRNHSARLQEDVERFLDALICNWLIGGTDAHAKNYGFLLAGGGQTRLAPVYDLSSCLPYPRDVPIRKAKLAMKIADKYLLSRIGPREWEKAATRWNVHRELVLERITRMATATPDAAQTVTDAMADLTKAERRFLLNLTTAISERAEHCLQQFNG